MASKLAQHRGRSEASLAIGADSELMSPPHLKDVLKTLEYFGIYQRFECIKCRQEFATINLALAHLRGEYLECKTGDVGKRMSLSVGKEVFVPRKPKKLSPKKQREIAQHRGRSEASLAIGAQTGKKEVTPLFSKRKKKHKYSLKEVEMILNKKKKDDVFAKQFGVKTHDIAKYRYLWKKHKKYKNLILQVPTPENIVTPNSAPKAKLASQATGARPRAKHVKNPHKYIKNPDKYNKPYKINKAAKGAQDYKVQPGEEAQ